MAERRLIVYAPVPDDHERRWRGTVEREDAGYRGREWRGPTVERVIQQMDKDIGPLEEAHYEVQG